MSEQTANPATLNEEKPVVHDTLSAMREYSSRYVSKSPVNAFRFLMDFIGVGEHTPEPNIPELFGQLADKIDAEYIPRDIYDAIVEQRDAISQQKEAADAQTRAVEAQIQAIASERDARHMKNIRYQSECSALQKKCDKLTGDIATTAQERDNFHEKLDLLTDKHNQVTTSYERLEALNNDVTEERNNLAAKLRDTETHNEDLLAEINRLNDSSDASDAQLVELTRSQSALKQNIDALIEERDNALRECNVTKQRLRELATQYQTATNKSQEIENTHIAQEQYESQIAELKRQVQDFEHEVETLHDRIRQADMSQLQAQENARIAGSREDAIRQELINIRTKRDDALQQVKTLTSERASTIQDYDNMLMAERGRFNAAMRNIRRKLMDAGIHSSIINVAFAGVGFDPIHANGESVDPEGDAENQRLVDTILSSAG